MPAQDFVVTSPEELAARTAVASERFTDLLRAVGPDVVVGGWSSRDVLVHLVNVVNRYNEFSPDRLAADPRGVDLINQQEIQNFDDRTLDDLLDVLAAEQAEFDAGWGPDRGIPLDAPLPFHGGTTIDVQSGLTNLLAEYLVHGLDVAIAAGEVWEIDERDGALLCGFATQILPVYVRRTNPHDVSVRFDLEGVAPWVLTLDGPTAGVRAPLPGDRPDVVLAGSPVDAALVFYGRTPTAEAGAIGLDTAGGARPEMLPLVLEQLESP